MSNYLPPEYFVGGAAPQNQLDNNAFSSMYQSPPLPYIANNIRPVSSSSGLFFGGSPNSMQSSSSGDRRLSRPTSAPRPPPGYFEQLAGIGLGIGNFFAETLLSHPCVVLRRQCQVNRNSTHFHLTPFTLLPAMYALPTNSLTGIFCFWKGVPSTTVLRGLNTVGDSVLADVLGWPRDATRYSSTGKIVKHLMLKSLTFALTTPFAISNVIETVQSDVVGERPGILEGMREAVYRVYSDFGGPHDSRRIPIWYLIGPSVGHRLSHYVISSLSRYAIRTSVKKQIMNKPAKQRSTFDDFVPDLFSSFASCLLADAILFPLETVVHRMYLQGARTLIDNLDTGSAVIVPVSTRYEGFFDCIKSIAREEGWCGFYKGFGALMLQYALHILVLRLLRVLFEHLEQLRRPDPPLPLPPVSQAASSSSASFNVLGDQELNLQRGY